MVSLQSIEDQLAKLGINLRFWGRPEVRELQHVLVQNEKIIGAVNGRYEGGFALLVVTDQRVLLIDKKPWFITVEDLRFDMISEVDYNGRLIDATIVIFTLNKTLRFTALKQKQLRAMTSYIQERIMDIRQNHNSTTERLAPGFDQNVQQLRQPIAEYVLPIEQQIETPKSFLPKISRPRNPYANMPLMTRRRFSKY